MSKLHEKLAVKSSVVGKVSMLLKEAIHTFTTKDHLFKKVIIETSFDKENTESVVDRQGSISETVAGKLAYVGKDLAKLIDLCNEINTTNTVAKADVVVGGFKLTAMNPMSLLELEKLLAEVKKVVEATPTLDPVKGFNLDTAEGYDIFKAEVVVRPKTEKTKVVLTKAPATDKHPAQVDVYDKDVKIGVIRQNEWSSMITPARKAEIAGRVEDLMNAVKEAISRANNTEVVGEKYGKQVVDYLFA